MLNTLGVKIEKLEPIEGDCFLWVDKDTGRRVLLIDNEGFFVVAGFLVEDIFEVRPVKDLGA